MASGVLPATGPIPKELERLKVPEVLGLDNNQLSGAWRAVLLFRLGAWFLFLCEVIDNAAALVRVVGAGESAQTPSSALSSGSSTQAPIYGQSVLYKRIK